MTSIVIITFVMFSRDFAILTNLVSFHDVVNFCQKFWLDKSNIYFFFTTQHNYFSLTSLALLSLINLFLWHTLWNRLLKNITKSIFWHSTIRHQFLWERDTPPRIWLIQCSQFQITEGYYGAGQLGIVVLSMLQVMSSNPGSAVWSPQLSGTPIS